ncbi:MAG: GntR family transcriptional regulator [Propionibacterium sp.]|nr:GntR family transcriptional regulator [Propionibacterium sp.]
MPLHVAISNRSGVPIYQQIVDQTRAAILKGELTEGELLPSIRGLARDLQISVITTTRAYSDLAQLGYILNVPGKGSYVQPPDADLIREHLLRNVENHLADAVDAASQAGLDAETLHSLLDLALQEGPQDD